MCIEQCDSQCMNSFLQPRQTSTPGSHHSAFIRYYLDSYITLHFTIAYTYVRLVPLFTDVC